MFDSLIQVIANKFGLGSKASWVLSALLGLLFKNKGGMSGFLEKLTRGGLGNLVESWLGKDEPLAVNATQVESVIGSDIINNLASKLNLPSGPIGMAIAYILPKVVSALTPDGVVPDSIPAGIAHYILDDEQEAAETEVKTPEPLADYVSVSESNNEDESSGFNWWWLLLIPLFLLLGWCTLQQPEEAIVSTTAPDPVVAPKPVAPIPSINPSLSISNEADSFFVSGTVADDATKDSIFGILNSIAGSDKVSGDILVDSAVKNANWLTKLSDILPFLKDQPGAMLKFDGDDITLDGSMKQGAIDGLMEKLKETFGGDGFNINSQAVGLAPSPQTPQVLGEAVEKAGNAIQDMVTSGTVTGESLVSALNVTGINFATGSFNIASESMAVLRDAAEAIKAAPAGIQIQVGGHTDNTGSKQINLKLSGQRAQAVVDALVGMGVDASVLSAKGYGDSQPVADNSSKEGRAQNRRMEFTLK